MSSSNRVPADVSLNRLTEALAALRRDERTIIDLTESNPTRVGLTYPQDLLAPLADVRGLTYAPQALGLLEARTAVAGEYARRGVRVDASRIALTASTSEAYSLLFKLLCNAGDEVLVPRPSYPLFEHLTRLDAVAAAYYDLDAESGWTVDFDSIDRAFTSRTRAILVVSPNNPTGSFVREQDFRRLAAMCAERRCALIVDEVFADYELVPHATAVPVTPFDPASEALVFSLGGLSKSVGLPQVKLGWIAVAGPDAVVESYMSRLEFACDAYLSVSTPVQLAAADLLRRGAAVREQIRARTRGNFCRLTDLVAQVPSCRVLPAGGGWSAVIQVPTTGTEEDLVLDLLMQDAVLVHPGYFFDFPRESYLIVSLLPTEATFLKGLATILRRFECSMWPA